MIEDLVRAWTFKEIQTAIVMNNWLRQNGHSMDELEEYSLTVMKKKKETLKRQELSKLAAQKATPQCQKCGGQMRLLPGDDENSCYWECRKCAWSEFRDNSFKAEKEAYRRRWEEALHDYANDEK